MRPDGCRRTGIASVLSAQQCFPRFPSLESRATGRRGYFATEFSKLLNITAISDRDPLPAVPQSQPSLAAAIDIPLWLERDRETPWAERVRRDRAIGREAIDLAPAARVMHWWHAVAPAPGESERGAAVSRLLRRLGLIMVAAGALSGAGLAAAVLRYDGSDPINILIAFGLLVLLPAVFLVASLTLPLWSSASFGGQTNAGHIVLGFLRRRHRAFDEFFATRHADQARDRVLRWRFTLSSQQLGLAFSVAALATLLMKASFSDLAFAWSTTLSVDAHQLRQAVGVIAAPWSGWLPDAVPDLRVIEQSRYFRLEQETRELSAVTLTPWWRFLALCIATYGVLPRASAFVLASLRARAAERAMLFAHPEVRALLDRLDAPEIAAGATSAEHAAAVPDAVAPLFDGHAQGDVIVIWNDAIARTALPADALVIEAGGERSPGDDREALQGIPAALNGIVRVVTKAWEPPLLELHDYLAALRARIGAGASIVVQPCGEGQATPEPQDLAVWRASLARLDDPGIYVQ